MDLIPNWNSHNSVKKSILAAISWNVNALIMMMKMKMTLLVYLVCQRGSSLVPIIGVASLQENLPLSHPLLINQLKVPTLRIMSQLEFCNNIVILFFRQSNGMLSTKRGWVCKLDHGKRASFKTGSAFSRIKFYERFKSKSKRFDIECLDKKLGDCGI